MHKLIIPSEDFSMPNVTVRYGVDDNNNGYVEFLEASTKFTDCYKPPLFELNEEQAFDLAFLLMNAMKIFNEKKETND